VELWIASSQVLLAMTMELANHFFIISVDAIFTTSFERLFTKSSDASRANTSNPCMYPRGITD
jgi:ABC-type branched-subunit amino acid transport system substrate-binding protein